MNTNSLSITQEHPSYLISKCRQKNVQIAQEKIYSFFLEIVNKMSPNDVIREFKNLFITGLDSDASGYMPKIYGIFLGENQEELSNTVKRCCYIIINSWKNTDQETYIKQLISLFVNESFNINSDDTSLVKICKIFLKNFVNSKNYQELKLFVAKYEQLVKEHWANRYSSYLLIDKSLNSNNSRDEQEAAKKLSKQMRDKFKFELAIYIAHSQSGVSSTKNYKNPTILGDQTLLLIKAIILKRGDFSYENIARIFVKQIENQTLEEFKISLERYLFFSIEKQQLVEIWKQHFIHALSFWKTDCNEQIVTQELFSITCNRVIDCLTIEADKKPSLLFILLITQGHALTLVIILLKLILICPDSRRHLEIRIAHLIRFYEKFPEDECKGIINFLEIFNITFAICAENVEYNLIKIEEEKNGNSQLNLDGYRIFSQMKVDKIK